MGRRVNVIGVGMTKFAKPGQSEDYHVMASKAAHAALQDARSRTARSSRPTPATSTGQHLRTARALRGGAHGHPRVQREQQLLHRVDRAHARQAGGGGRPGRVRAGRGLREDGEGRARVEVHRPREPASASTRRRHDRRARVHPAPPTAQMFGGAGREYRWKYGAKKETFGQVSVKARKHAANNPYAIFNQTLTLEEVMASEEVFDPLTRYQCCPPTCGAAAAVLCSDDFAKKHGIANPVWIAAQAMTTDYPSSFEKSMIKMVGYDMTMNAGKKVYEQAGLGPEDVEVVRAARLLLGQRDPHLRGAGLVQGGRGREVHLGGRQHVRRQVVDQPVGRVAVEGPPAGRHRPRAVHGARVAAARPGGQAPGAEREGGAAAQPGPRRSVRRDDVPPRLARA